MHLAFEALSLVMGIRPTLHQHWLMVLYEIILRLMILTLNDFLSCFISGRRFNEYNFRPTFHICLQHGCPRCSHCAYTITVSQRWSLSFPMHQLCYYNHMVLHIGVSLIISLIDRYLILVILFWRLMKTVNLLPPKASHLKLGRFLKNGRVA